MGTARLSKGARRHGDKLRRKATKLRADAGLAAMVADHLAFSGAHEQAEQARRQAMLWRRMADVLDMPKAHVVTVVAEPSPPSVG